MILALAGGVGGAKLADGLAAILPEDALTIAVNTGDDFEHLGLGISPDLDTMMYTLAGLNNREQGWGLAGESWGFMEALERLGGEIWFRLGDRDLATHIERTRRRKQESLSAITDDFCKRLGIRHRIVPMSDDPVRTIVESDAGLLSFQDYFVRLACRPRVTGLRFAGIEQARPSAALLAALEAASAIVVCPSNPFLSILPILSLPGIRDVLERRRAPLVAVSPIVGGQAVKGPAAKIMHELGFPISPAGVAAFYGNLLDGIVIDEIDRDRSGEVAGPELLVADTIMRDRGDKARLAREVVDFVRRLVRR